MKVIRCDHGHWYDADAYTKCPHCNPSKGIISPISDTNRSRIQPQSEAESSLYEVTPPTNNRNQFIDPVEGVMSEENSINKTFSAFSQNGSATFEETQNEPSDGIQMDIHVSEPVAEQATDLQKELQGVSNSSVQKTMSYFGKVSQSQGGAEPSHNPQRPLNCAPVVGWLVCIAGPHIGQSFNITAGKNSIGRGPDNDIVLSDDQTVSGNRHAWVTYEAKHRNFILQAGDGRYPDLNGEQVIEGRMLKIFDKIELGETMLLFVNLCGDTFAWEDYLNKE